MGFSPHDNYGGELSTPLTLCASTILNRFRSIFVIFEPELKNYRQFLIIIKGNDVKTESLFTKTDSQNV